MLCSQVCFGWVYCCIDCKLSIPRIGTSTTRVQYKPSTCIHHDHIHIQSTQTIFQVWTVKWEIPYSIRVPRYQLSHREILAKRCSVHDSDLKMFTCSVGRNHHQSHPCIAKYNSRTIRRSLQRRFKVMRWWTKHCKSPGYASIMACLLHSQSPHNRASSAPCERVSKSESWSAVQPLTSDSAARLEGELVVRSQERLYRLVNHADVASMFLCKGSCSTGPGSRQRLPFRTETKRNGEMISSNKRGVRGQGWRWDHIRPWDLLFLERCSYGWSTTYVRTT